MSEQKILGQLIEEISRCTLCESSLPLAPKPIFQCSSNSSILILGQAPGMKAHESGTPWDDPSGYTLRQWLAVSEETFYNTDNFALVPMGFCYPGKGISGDLPPRKECAETWHGRLLDQLSPKVTFVTGAYSQKYIFEKRCAGVTKNVKRWKDFFTEGYIPLPHPSPRNHYWLKKNKWFDEEVIPEIHGIVKRILKI